MLIDNYLNSINKSISEFLKGWEDNSRAYLQRISIEDHPMGIKYKHPKEFAFQEKYLEVAQQTGARENTEEHAKEEKKVLSPNKFVLKLNTKIQKLKERGR